MTSPLAVSRLPAAMPLELLRLKKTIPRRMEKCISNEVGPSQGTRLRGGAEGRVKGAVFAFIGASPLGRASADRLAPENALSQDTLG